MTTMTVNAQNIDWQGHRGCRGLMPENTIEAFLEALKYPVTTLELDVVISKDHQVVVSHEPWISDKICLNNGKEFRNGSKPKFIIYQMDYSKVRTFECGVKPNSEYPYQKKIKAFKPLLSEVFNHVEEEVKNTPKAGIKYNIEIKSFKEGDGVYHPEAETFVKEVIEEIRKHISDDRYSIQSFDLRVLEIMHMSYPEITIALLVESNGLEANLDKLSFKPDIYSPNYRRVNKKEVALAHEMGILIIPWTINTAGGINKMLKLGVDGIITDYPNLIAEFR